jgi:hypothetical protein
MATVVFSRPFDMSDTSTQTGFSQNGATLIRIQDNANDNLATLRQDYIGNFTYTNGTLTGGTLNQVTISDRASTTDSFAQTSDTTGLSADAVQAFEKLSSADVNAFYSFIYSGSDSFTGSSGNDVINSFGGDDTVHAGAGDDIIRGGDGNDSLFGEDGSDTFYSGNGNDSLDGGNGFDSAVYAFARASYTVTGTPGSAMTVAHATEGTDTLASINNLFFTEMKHGGTFRGGGETHYADVTGDGRPDLLFQGTDNAFWLSAGNSGNGFDSPVKVAQHGGSFRTGGETHFADVTGDGKADLVFQGTDNAFWLSTSTGTGFTDPVKVMQHGGQFRDGTEVQYADVNNDGKADMVFQGTDNAFWLSLSNGNGFNAPQEIADLPDSYKAGQANMVDLANDHTADLVFQTGDNAFLVANSGTDFTFS